jgi:3',5'-cyclic AMP phosphodiesterase CpdA
VLRILHLSDLHLGPNADASTGEYKASVVPAVERQSRQGRIRQSLGGVARYLGGECLDAIVVTGDVSYQDAAEGFAELDALLESLGDKRPEADKILIVPGNHDVRWGSEAGKAPRYDDFVHYIRDQGFRTPLLEGIDIDPTSGADIGSVHDPFLDLGTVLLVGINSANYCGVDSPMKYLHADDIQALEEESIADPDSRSARVWRDIQWLRRHDVCRVSEGQIIALTRRLQTTADPWRLRIAALHHHLLPVSSSEEVKTFESMVNLGQFRQFLASSDFRAVLHGHKHVPYVYLDPVGTERVVRSDLRLNRPPILVSSVATVWTAADPEACRLLTIDDDLMSVRELKIYSFPALTPGKPAPTDLPEVGSGVCLRTYASSNVRIFEGRSVDDVYGQLRQAFPANSTTVIPNVLCRIENGSTALKPPTEYPDPLDEEKAAWFKDTVDWWQRPDPWLIFPQFNHGERLHNFQHDHIDQLTNLVEALRSERKTTRAVAVLFDARKVGDERERQPAFCLVQFRVISTKVHCEAYFRKQQMRAWWPINVAEIAYLQKGVSERLVLESGEIVTYSAHAFGGTDRPRVIVPWVDRVQQDDIGKLWELALALVFPEHRWRADICQRWEKVFNDWRPDERREKDGVPIALLGLDVLSKAAKTLGNDFAQDQLSLLGQRLEDLFNTNKTYWEQDLKATNEDDRNTLYGTWRANVSRTVDEMLEIVQGLAK